jgi:hypothetical protein
MRIVFNIEVGVDVPTFVQAGEILDKVVHDLEFTLKDRGQFDIRSFETAHTPIRRYSEAQDMMAEKMPMEEVRNTRT